MWIVLGTGSVITAVLNLVFFFKKRENKWFSFSSLSLTALTVCAFYSDVSIRVINKDWTGLEDIVPTTSYMLWIAVVLSILINGIPLVVKEIKTKKS